MLISLCIPVMNRLRDLKVALPTIVKSANTSPPCEIVIVNYSSSDGLTEYLNVAQKDLSLVPGNTWKIVTVKGKRYYHSTHARNVAGRAASGEYLIHLAADALPQERFVSYIRERLESVHPVWMCEARVGRFIVVRKDEFETAGGYDERFTLYAPEDRDLCARLHRRGGSFETFPLHMATELYTPYREKLANLDKREFEGMGQIKREMAHKMKPILDGNNAIGALVANKGREWGRWDS